ncbi:MAG: flippase-like domain-containing protein [Candidatus Omnitrophica bacterium]|nr:flippase-like domain-containing protein [Candidatus Omnitrophota bacterium]
MKKNIFFWMRLAISIGAVLFLLFTFRGRLGDVYHIVKGINLWALIAGFILIILSQSLVTARLKEIMNAQDVLIPYKNLFFLTMIALFFNNFLPSSLGGDVVKAYYAGKQSKKTMEPYTAIFTDRAIGYVTLISWSAIGLCFYRDKIQNPAVLHSVLAMTLAAFGLILFFTSRRVSSPYRWLVGQLPSALWRGRLFQLYDCVNGYRQHPFLMLTAVALSALSHVSLIFMNWLLVRGLGFDVSFGILMLLLPIIGVVQNAPSINGLGIREGAYVFFLGQYITAEGALALSVAFYMVFLAASFCGGIIYLIGGGKWITAWSKLEPS